MSKCAEQSCSKTEVEGSEWHLQREFAWRQHVEDQRAAEAAVAASDAVAAFGAVAIGVVAFVPNEAVVPVGVDIADAAAAGTGENAAAVSAVLSYLPFDTCQTH